ncbi:MAG: hypothetical protein WDN25_03925 [Acetobacteraceae bacterium]
MTNPSRVMKTMRIKPDGSGYTVAGGTSDVNSDIVDTAGFDGVRFIVGFGAITSGGVQSIKLQQNTANSGGAMADLAGTGITVADTDDNKIAIAEVFRPAERYLRVVTKRATQNSAIDFCLVELFDPRVRPITDDASVIASEVASTPAEGTA